MQMHISTFAFHISQAYVAIPSNGKCQAMDNGGSKTEVITCNK